MTPRPRTRSASTAPPALRVFALGSLRIVRNGEPVPSAAWVRLKSRTLFAYLLCARPRGVHKEVLIDLLWPSAEPTRGAHALQVAMSDLRATLTGRAARPRSRSYVVRMGELYSLDVGEAGWVDAEAFEASCAAGRRAEAAGDREAVAHLLAAEALYGGDFLSEERYAEWAVARRERLRDDYLDVLLRLERHHELAGDIEAAARFAKKVLAVDPYLEPCYRSLMRHLKALGDHGGVIRTYARCKEAMREGFDGDVAPETRALAEALVGSRVDSLVRRHRPSRPPATSGTGAGAAAARHVARQRDDS
jgi:DNA-binding SARP family transcriptional activator